MGNSGDYLDYNGMLDAALLGIAKKALAQVAENGLFGEHFFYITFKTGARGVIVPDFLLRQHPDTLTIIIQYEFSNLSVGAREFSVTLSFNNFNYHIIVPFHALVAFSDPSTNFSLTFNAQGEPEAARDDEPELYSKDDEGKIISISDFIKKGSLPQEPDDAA
ncbi:MAG: ClpXP protease specificity-enhancing factor SspB [Rickettsiales bacterium]|jgi:hypothetical protein|nr:ClpXP protease specificity-enhancing factor SspB [Rickettsiales bacterium]